MRFVALNITEISLVDHPCIRMPWSILKHDSCTTNRCQHDLREFVKVDSDQHEIIGCVYPLSNTPDCQDDFVNSRDVLAGGAQSWLDNGSVVKVQHQGGAVDGIEIVKSELSSAPMMLGGQRIPEGSWMLHLRISNPAVWAQIESGELRGYSIGGSGTVAEKAQTDVPAWAREADEIEEEAMSKCHCQQKSAQSMTEAQEEAELHEMVQQMRQFNEMMAQLDDAPTPSGGAISAAEADRLIQYALLRQAQQMTAEVRWQNQYERQTQEMGGRYAAEPTTRRVWPESSDEFRTF